MNTNDEHVDFFFVKFEVFFRIPDRIQAIIFNDSCLKQQLGLTGKGELSRVELHLDIGIYNVFFVTLLFGYLRTTDNSEVDLLFLVFI